MKPVVSTREFAKAVGRSESTIKRWVDSGNLAAIKTTGGHRRIAIDEAIRFTRAERLRVVRPEVLGLPPEAATSAEAITDADEAERLHRALVAGEAAHARGILLSMFLSGRSVAAICDGPLRESMERIGLLWRQPTASGILIEHRATEICASSLHRIRSMTCPSVAAPLIVAGAIQGDQHGLAALAAAVMLESEGFRTVFLGADTPVDTFITAADLHRPVMVCASVTMALHARTLAAQVGRLAVALHRRGVRLALGGNAVDQIRQPSDRGILIGKKLAELLGFAQTVGAAQKGKAE